MEIIKGKFSCGIVFSNTAEVSALNQVKNILDNPVSAGSSVRVMCDVHPGKVAPIGLSMTLGERILPYLVGIDAGCGVLLAKIEAKRGFEWQKLDSVILENVPSGFAIRKKMHRFSENLDLSALHCARNVRQEKSLLALGTLGGGNHFIEIEKNSSGDFFIAIHTGSRSLGREVADFYLSAGQKALVNRGENVPYELTYLSGDLMAQYLSDLKIVQDFAQENRLAILDEIARNMKWKISDVFDCRHNYVDFRLEKPILRKGAISALKGERVVIPVNMRDGIIIGEGKGNADWNFSAPHGSGRVMKREDVKKCVTVSAFKSAMKGVYSSCISKSTLDECPQAYRGLDEILGAIEPTVAVKDVMKSVYNFKAGSKEK